MTGVWTAGTHSPISSSRQVVVESCGLRGTCGRWGLLGKSDAQHCQIRAAGRARQQEAESATFKRQSFPILLGVTEEPAPPIPELGITEGPALLIPEGLGGPHGSIPRWVSDVRPLFLAMYHPLHDHGL